MSTEDLGDQISQVIEEYQAGYTDEYVLAAASEVILIFDHLLTFGREVNFFWNRRVSGPTVLFILNRYLALILRIFSSLSLRPFTNQVSTLTFPCFQDVSLMYDVLNFIELKYVYNSCTTLDNTISVLEFIQPIPPAAFSAMRALALSQSRPLAVLVLVFSIVNVGFDFGVPQYHRQSFSDPTWGCLVVFLSIPTPVLITGEVLSRSLLILADGIVIFLTWKNARSSEMKLKTGSPRTLNDIMLRNGAMYFVVFLIINTLRMATTLRGVGNIIIVTPGQDSLISAFNDPITTILVSRFLLDLQEAHQRTVKLGTDDPLHSSASEFQVGIGSLQFAVDAMGSIGADLRSLDETHTSRVEDNYEPDRVLRTEDAENAE
ncbi:uncharacterized protein BXZ73DRAFT_85824 [Epithele typhae]|uniref:uncharacterized protein n=1 Tax=Epithele typhae TaxID=378194 RepID=UPI0020072C2D|nr:uncharacterized protein BXZ73DRAFT_85824 [Epithele typhae]KAH9897340.1 hypothetical protein BXZ73DRAFT_85824 [Epithele typhae]